MKIPKAQLLPSGKWFMRLRLDGQAYSKTFDTEKEAETWAYLIKSQHKAHQLKPVHIEQKTLRELIDQYISEVPLSDNTKSIFKTIKKHFTQAMDKPISQVRNWQRIVNLETAHPNSVALWWREICSVMRFYGLDIPQVKINKVPAKRKNYLVPGEVKRFCECITGHKYEAYFLLMLSSLRISEALNVREEDITEDGIFVHGTKTEAAERFVPFMPDRLRKVIHDRPHATRQMVAKSLKEVCEENGFPELSPHSLRISFASMCYSKNVPSRVCMEIGGWKSLQVMHDVYVRISEDDVKRYADDVATLFR